MRAIRYIPGKVAIRGPMLLLTELIVLACGVDAQTNDASGSSLTGGTLTSFKRHRNSFDCESPKAANYNKIAHQLDPKWKVAKEMVGRRLSQGEAKRLLAKFELGHACPCGVGAAPGLASIASRSFFLSGQLLLGNLSKTVVVVGNAPHDRPGFLVRHLIANRASFLCTEAPMLRVPDGRSGWHGQWTTKSSLEQRSI